MALTDLTRISTSGIATGSTIDSPILRKDVDYRGSQVGVNTILFDSSDNSLKFKDSAKAKFGDSNDLEVYHDGSHSHIREVGTGDLRLRSSKILLMNENSQEYFVGTSGGSVELYFNDNQKFRTTNDGAVVSGILTATGFSGPIRNPSGISTFYDLRVTNNLTVEGTTSTLDTTLIGVDRVEVDANSNSIVGVAVTQSGTADIINLFDGSTEVLTVTDGGKVGIGTNNPTSSAAGARLAVHLDDNTAYAGGTNRGNGIFVYNTAAGGHSSLELAQRNAANTYGSVILNAVDPPAGNNYGAEFTIQTRAAGGGSYGERLRITSAGKVGINDDNPERTLDVVGNNAMIQIEGSGGNGRQYSLCSTDNTTGAAVGSAGQFVIYDDTSGASRLNITSDGKVGIKETTPEATFEVDGRIRVLDNNDAAPSTGKGLEISYFNTDDMADILSYDRSAGAYKKLQLRGDSIELKRHNNVYVNIGTGGSQSTVGFSTTAVLVTNGEKIAVRGYSSFKSTSASYSPIYVASEGNTNNVANQMLMFNSNGANRGGFGYVPNTGELRLNNQYFLTFCTGASLLNGTERLRISSNGQISTRGATGTSFNNAGTSDFGSFLTVNGGHTANQWGILSLEGNTSANENSIGAIQFINQNNANGSSGGNTQSRLLAKIEAYSATSDSNAGDDSGGDLRFYTKPEAANPLERLRIKPDGQLIHNAKNASGHVAEFNQTNGSNDARILINSPTDNNIRPAFIQLSNAGTAKWGIGQVYASTSSGAFHLLAGDNQESNSKFVVTTAGRVGVGTFNPGRTLDVQGSSNLDILKVTNHGTSLSNDFYTLRVDSSAHSSNMTSAGAFAVEVNDSVGGHNGRAFTINGMGNIGIGTNSPAGVLDIKTDSGTYEPLRIRRTGSGAGDSDWSLKPYGGHLFFRTAGANDKVGFSADGQIIAGAGSIEAGSSTKLCVVGSGSPAVNPSTIAASTLATFRMTGGLGHAAGISILGGNTGSSTLNFGDRDNETIGRILYNHTSGNTDDYMAFYVQGGEKLRITPGGTEQATLVIDNVGTNGNTWIGDNYTASATEHTCTIGNMYSGGGFFAGYAMKPQADGWGFVSSTDAYADRRACLTIGGSGYDAFRVDVTNSNQTITTGDAVTTARAFGVKHNGDVEIPDGNLIVASGHGIDFSATGNASGMTGELLNDYEEGTWTPALTNVGTITYSHQLGRYTKVGRQVHFMAYIRWNSRTNNGSYNIKFTGLPFTSADTGYLNSPIYVGGNEGLSGNNSSYTHIGGNVGKDSTSGQFRISNTTGSSEISLTGAAGNTTAGYIYFGGTYYV